MRLWRVSLFALGLAAGCFQTHRRAHPEGPRGKAVSMASPEAGAREGERALMPPGAVMTNEGEKAPPAARASSATATPSPLPWRPVKAAKKTFISAAIEFTVGAVGSGSVTVPSSFGWGDKADLESELSMDSTSSIAARFGLDFIRGPGIRVDYTAFASRAQGGSLSSSEFHLFLFDADFTPFRTTHRWGRISASTGFRYAKWGIEIKDLTAQGKSLTYDETIEGLMVMAGARAEMAIARGFLGGEAELRLGLGPDSSSARLDLGVGFWPRRPFRLKMGYRLTAVRLADGLGSASERRAALCNHALALEIGLVF